MVNNKIIVALSHSVIEKICTKGSIFQSNLQIVVALFYKQKIREP
jgi:hypothetical protein